MGRGERERYVKTVNQYTKKKESKSKTLYFRDGRNCFTSAENDYFQALVLLTGMS